MTQVSPPASLLSSSNEHQTSSHTSKQWPSVVEVLDDDEEMEEEMTPWTPIQSRVMKEEDVVTSSRIDDYASAPCLKYSLGVVHSIASRMDSVSEGHPNDHHRILQDEHPSKLSETFFEELRKSQATAQRLGLEGAFFNPLLISVLQEHVHVIQTMSVRLASGIIDLVPVPVETKATATIKKESDTTEVTDADIKNETDQDPAILTTATPSTDFQYDEEKLTEKPEINEKLKKSDQAKNATAPTSQSSAAPTSKKV
ncbi:hypothetical protein BGZ65_010269, partial [Modicella reniformis]